MKQERIEISFRKKTEKQNITEQSEKEICDPYLQMTNRIEISFQKENGYGEYRRPSSEE